MKFRKKPVVIDAYCLPEKGKEIDDRTGHGPPAWLVSAIVDGEVRPVAGEAKFIIPTLEGEMTANPGDWIIRGIKGELYPCKPDIFAATYEEVQS